MRVDEPGQGTGRGEPLPHRRPNWVRVLTNIKMAACASGLSALTSSRQTRLQMCCSASRIPQGGKVCNHAH